MLTICAFVLALCSITYELLLGQILSAFLGNTVLRYSVTIGLYMMSMGVGALFASGKIRNKPLLSLQWIEIALSLLGCFSLSFLFLIHGMGIEGAIFSGVAHGLILLIGFLTGLELPLLFSLAKQINKTDRSIILGIDYIGAFAGTILFAFVLYPELGLFPSSFLIGSLNAVVGVMLYFFARSAAEEYRARAGRLARIQAVILIVAIVGYSYSDLINRFWLDMYVS